MADWTSAIEVEAAPEAVFRFISDVTNLPRYLPTVARASSQAGERVAVEGDANGRHFQSDGFFKVDTASKTIRWGSDGENDYHGEMRCVGDGASTRVEVRLHFVPKPEIVQSMARSQGGEQPAMQDGLEAALRSIKQQCEGTGGKAGSSAER